MSVVAGRDKHPRRCEVIDDGCCDFVETSKQYVARRARGQRDVHGETKGIDAADLSGAAAARIERPLMGRDEQDVGVVPEDRLRAVAVVDVPVDDGSRSPRLRRAAATTATLFK